MKTSTLQAEKKWCPLTRVRPRGEGVHTKIEDEDTLAPVAVNREAWDEGIDQLTSCVGYCCMMWRWLDRPKSELDENARGYCGLAGRPEI